MKGSLKSLEQALGFVRIEPYDVLGEKLCNFSMLKELFLIVPLFLFISFLTFSSTVHAAATNQQEVYQSSNNTGSPQGKEPLSDAVFSQHGEQEAISHGEVHRLGQLKCMMRLKSPVRRP